MDHGTSEFPPPNTDPLDALNWDEFDYLTPSIDQLGPDAFLPTSSDTIAALNALGASMTISPAVPGSPEETDSTIPAPYTYLGQFIDHDITKTITAPGATLNPDELIGSANFEPLSFNLTRALLRNQRTGSFDLDSLYGLKPLKGEEDLAIPMFQPDGDRFRIDNVSAFRDRPPGKLDDNDLPRRDSPDPEKLGTALIGDPRNDENVIVAQMHLAFLKFHNAVVADGFPYEKARELVTHHYQWVVLQDFLPRVCEQAVLNDVINNGNRLYKHKGSEKFMPFEFAVAAYRFGHSMVRSTYDFNINFRKQAPNDARVGSLDKMFRFSRLSGDMVGRRNLPENWIIQWEDMFSDRAMAIDPTLTSFLSKLPKQQGPADVMEFLAKRNLLKGYLFHLPTGQALAELVLPEGDRLTSAELEQACRAKTVEASGQLEALRAGGFITKTPLWFYILAEARIKQGGNRLGPLGSRIVCETIIGLLRANPQSILNQPFVPTLGKRSGKFDLQDLLIKAGVLVERIEGI